MDIVVDFDGTVVTHEYPKVGKDIGAIPVLKELIENGHRLILFTMRCNKELEPINYTKQYENYLNDAVDWFIKNDIKLFGIQTNPTQSEWTTSPKAYGQLIIDDATLGCPLIKNLSISERPYVDWITVRKMLVEKGLIKNV